MHKILFGGLSLVLLCFFQQMNAKQDYKLFFVQILFRHGDRAPLNLYPNDPNPVSFWKEGLGKLTLLGKKQHYALGKYFRKMYENFMTSNPNEVEVISTEHDRCLKSAEANLASFFKPTSKWKFDENLDWQPISIRYSPKAQDKIFTLESDCPRASAEYNRVLNSSESQASISEHKEVFKNWTINSGLAVTDWMSAIYLQDVLFIEKKYNLTIPAWVEPYWEELENTAESFFYWTWNSPLLLRLRAGPLLKKMIEMMKNKIAGEIPLQKFQIYSAHDANVAMILKILKMNSIKRPPYCASLLLELYESPDSENTVRILYLNSTTPETEIQSPDILILEGCTEYCPLKYFINFVKDFIPDDWEKECQMGE